MTMGLVKGWNADVVDVETAFLYEDLEEEIYMQLTEGYKSLKMASNDEHLALQKVLYGLVQAAWQWWKKFIWTLIQLGFSKCETDVCLLNRIDKNGVVVFFIYINDSGCVGNRKAIDILVVQLKGIFNIKILGTLWEYIGCWVMPTKDGKGYMLFQPNIIQKIKEKFGSKVEGMKEVEMPFPAGGVVKHPSDKEKKMTTKCRPNTNQELEVYSIWLSI